MIWQVLCQDNTVLSHRVKVSFHGDGTAASPCNVAFTLEYEDGDAIVRQEGTLQGALLEVSQQACPALM